MRTRSRALLLVLMTAGCLSAAGVWAQPAAPPASCPAASALAPGTWARLANETPNNLRAAPGLRAERIGTITPGDLLRVLGGPLCADNYRYWQVDYAGVIGWTADGEVSARTPWLAALAGQAVDSAPAADDPPGCLRPPENYTRIQLGWATLNLRTLAMLDHAQALYTAGGGIIRFRRTLMQGSYNAGAVTASFGTHDGGGAVDLSVRDAVSRVILEREIEPMLRALRTAGFAAWLRAADELYPGSAIHIHAIAVGDVELSEAARAQIDGEFGYFNGYNGLPPGWGGPARDAMPAVVCAWMREHFVE
jgi:hypothetical protein